jgi:aldehyde dehydrogenase (NAD+)
MTEILTALNIEERNLSGFCGEWMGSGPELTVTTPIDGSRLATVQQVTEEEYGAIISHAHDAFLHWRTVPAPRRDELVHQIGDRLREVKGELGALVTLVDGKDQS